MSGKSKDKIYGVLEKIEHPESGNNLVEAGMVDSVAISDERIAVTLTLPRPRDPFAKSIRRQAEAGLAEAFPAMEGKIAVVVREGAPHPKTTACREQKERSATGGIGRVIAVASGKGGVGKSTVTANLAVTLAGMGYAVGILDADIYGPSMPMMFGVENYRPGMVERDGRELLVPAEAYGVKLNSIGFFINDSDALVWRGPMATGALRQLIHQTDWGRLDFLLVDLPPGTGDVHLTVLQETSVDGAVVVSTPQQIAVADVVRGIKMFRTPGIDVPVLGVIENMAWFTPAELPENRYYIFGRGGAAALAEMEGVPLLGEIPMVQSVMEGAENGKPAVLTTPAVAEAYRTAARKIVDNLA